MLTLCMYSEIFAYPRDMQIAASVAFFSIYRDCKAMHQSADAPSLPNVPEASATSHIQAVLDSHNVRYKRLLDRELPQAPSLRLLPNTFAFPGSRSDFNHVLFLSETKPNTLLAVAYSKNSVQTGIGQAEKEAMLLKMLELNAAEPLVVWKLEDRRGSLFPVLEETIMLQGAEHRSQDLIWKGCGTLDVLYKAKVSALTPPLLTDSSEVGRKVKDFLVATGFKKVKESTIPSGWSYLVVMSSDEEPEESKWKRFPMKIDVTGILAFRIYFSLDDAAVTGKGHFPLPAKALIARLNYILPVGYYNYASSSNQIQLTLKLHYKTLSAVDLSTSIRAYYDACILYYKGTVISLGTLHRDVEMKNRSISEITEYFNQVQEDMQGEYRWKQLDYAENKAQKDLGIQLLKTLSDNLEVAPYLLPKPFYKLEARGVYVKVSSRLLPVKECAQHYPLMQYYIYRLVLELFDILCSVDIYPTMDMLYCSSTSPLQLRMVPDKGLHRDRTEFLQNFSQLELIKASLTDTSLDVTNSDLVRLNWESFEVPILTSLETTVLVKIGLGEQKCLLYSISLVRSPKKPSFTVNYSNYMSLMGRLKANPNPLLGWTEAQLNMQETTELESTSSPQYFLCERYDYVIWRGNALFSTLRQVALAIQDLHSMGYCHWFISPLTIRQQDRKRCASSETVLVLPTLTPTYSGFIYSFIPWKFRNFIAPEAKQHIKEGIPVYDLFAVDVYSFCQVIIEMLKAYLERVELQALREVVTRGSSTDWRLRPSLSDVTAQLKEIY